MLTHTFSTLCHPSFRKNHRKNRKIAISFQRSQGPGKGYVAVALSRSKSLGGLYLIEFDPKQLKIDPKVSTEMQRLSTKAALPWPFDLPATDCMSVSLLNARSAKLHFKDVTSHPLLKQTDIICLTETHTETDDNASLHQIDWRHMILLQHLTFYCIHLPWLCYVCDFKILNAFAHQVILPFYGVTTCWYLAWNKAVYKSFGLQININSTYSG